MAQHSQQGLCRETHLVKPNEVHNWKRLNLILLLERHDGVNTDTASLARIGDASAAR